MDGMFQHGKKETNGQSLFITLPEDLFTPSVATTALLLSHNEDDSELPVSASTRYLIRVISISPVTQCVYQIRPITVG